jgi:hypothetical protein
LPGWTRPSRTLGAQRLEDLVPAGTVVAHRCRSLGHFTDHLGSSVRSMLISRVRPGRVPDSRVPVIRSRWKPSARSSGMSSRRNAPTRRAAPTEARSVRAGNTAISQREEDLPQHDDLGQDLDSNALDVDRPFDSVPDRNRSGRGLTVPTGRSRSGQREPARLRRSSPPVARR